MIGCIEYDGAKPSAVRPAPPKACRICWSTSLEPLAAHTCSGADRLARRAAQVGGQVGAQRDGVPVGVAVELERPRARAPSPRSASSSAGSGYGFSLVFSRYGRRSCGAPYGVLPRSSGRSGSSSSSHDASALSATAHRRRAWAGRSSASARASTCARDLGAGACWSYSTTWMPRRNDCTDRPLEWRAQPPVGSTWLEPAQ